LTLDLKQVEINFHHFLCKIGCFNTRIILVQEHNHIGWREWVGLPELGISRIKAKIDTGARTSALDVSECEVVKVDGRKMARFTVKYGSPRKPKKKSCIAEVVDERRVTDSGGHPEERVVIITEIRIGANKKRVEVTLAKRQGMKFRMLLGRSAISDEYLVDAKSSYLRPLG
jgi:hypothetical protein